MLKKNMRKRLLAGALATIMALTMCPTWALAVDEGTTLPAPEGQTPVVDSTPTGDTIQTPDAGTQGQTKPQDTEQAGQLENQDSEQAPSGGTDIEETGNNSSSNENDSQNNDAVSNSPANEIATTSSESDFATYDAKTVKYFVLLPGRDTPTSGADQGKEHYLPNYTGKTGSDGGVWGCGTGTGYKNGSLTEAGFTIADEKYNADDAKNGYTVPTGIDVETYLEPPSNLGYFTASNWKSNGTYGKYTNTKNPKSILGADFDASKLKVVWYTIKKQDDGYHVDGYVSGAEVHVTYYPNYANNGISGKNENPIVDNETSGDTYTIRGDDTFEAPEGYFFGGWYTEAACNNKFTDTTTVLMNSLNLYAKWNPNECTVTWEYEDGTFIDSVGVPYEGKPSQNPKASKASTPTTDYVFAGWKVKEDKSNKLVDPTQIAVTEDVTYVAVFNPVQRKYKVTWNDDDGTFIADTEVPYEGMPSKNPEVSKAADDEYTYTFKGWRKDGDATNKIVEPTTIEVTEDVTYIAVYEKNRIQKDYQYTINKHFYDEKGDKVKDENGEPQTAAENTPINTLYTANAQETVNGQNYVYVPSLTTVTDDLDKLTKDVTIDLYYYLDVKGNTTDPDNKGNGTPDAWEYRVAFKVVNGNWNNDTNADVIVYVPFKDENGNAIASDKVAIPNVIPAVGEKPAAGYHEGKWDTIPVVGDTVANDAVFTYTYAKIPDPINYHYTINKHFYNEKDVEVNVDKGGAKSAVENTDIKDLYTANKQETFENQNYVYVPGLTKVTDNLKKLTKDVTIDLYYYLDVKGGEKPDETGNGTPDAWEYRLAFKVVNGEWNKGGSADIVVYVAFKDYKNGETFKEVVVPITSIPEVGDKPNSGYRAGSWDTTPVGNAKVEKDTVFTYTYAKRSSGGGGGGGSRKPTVTIPDDVPTGLNGDDHYAYIVGYPDSTVRPQNGITRAEVATIFFRLLTDETRNANSTKSNSYSDVAAGAWYNHAVSTLSAMGIVKGDSNGKFNPNAPITRAEFAAIAARFDDKANTTAVDFSDIASHWAKDEISAAANNGWINGYTDGTFRPNNKITRAEAMTLVNRVLKRLPETAEDLHNDMIKWSDNSDTSAWYYLAVQEATNSHYYDLKENKHEKWSKLRETRDWTELEK